MDNLVEVLEEENTQYKRLVELSKNKKEAIIKLRNLDIRRDAVLKDMADVLGKDFEEMTITRLIGYLEQQPKEQERLSIIRNQILETGNEMQAWNKRNEVLLNQALEMVEFDLTLFKSMRQAPETANYNKDAYNTGDLLGGSGFDAKQ
ncbi:MAG: flagellin biosynthesis protein FlgN [Roseburia sp. 40_7]|nr:MAG: flagellin biosynthesis protein FlgN [Roseburia sp. 40_7]